MALGPSRKAGAQDPRSASRAGNEVAALVGLNGRYITDRGRSGNHPHELAQAYCKNKPLRVLIRG